jgi:flagellar protein FlgJ
MADLNSLNISGLSQYAAESASDKSARMLSDATSKVNKAKSSEDKEEVNEELMDACKQFEAYLMEQVYKGYEKTVKVFSKEEDNSMGTLVDYFKDITIQNITTMQSDTQSPGLAQMLYENMKRNYDV